MKAGDIRFALQPITDEATILIEIKDEEFLYLPVKAEIRIIDGEGFIILKTVPSPYKRYLLYREGKG